MTTFFHVIGLLLGTFALLAFALALYDLFLQIATITNLFSTASSSTLTWQQIRGQAIFVFVLFLIGIVILSIFRTEGSVYGEERALKDADLIRGSSVAFVSTSQLPTK